MREWVRGFHQAFLLLHLSRITGVGLIKQQMIQLLNFFSKSFIGPDLFSFLFFFPQKKEAQMLCERFLFSGLVEPILASTLLVDSAI